MCTIDVQQRLDIWFKFYGTAPRWPHDPAIVGHSSIFYSWLVRRLDGRSAADDARSAANDPVGLFNFGSTTQPHGRIPKYLREFLQQDLDISKSIPFVQRARRFHFRNAQPTGVAGFTWLFEWDLVSAFIGSWSETLPILLTEEVQISPEMRHAVSCSTQLISRHWLAFPQLPHFPSDKLVGCNVQLSEQVISNIHAGQWHT